ncbi:MAG: UDP-3-O-(3-hydroxymyristoyl)glucosamine N-acyltransferase [Parachlamydiales bacterium]|jgi:UDP-3-O-[3-hydroxymyristoyl] glucosamine N-acyltransferase
MAQSYSLEELSLLTGAQLFGDKAKRIEGVATLEKAQTNELSFLANARYLEELKTTRAGAVCLDVKTAVQKDQNYLVSENPSATFQKVCELFLKEEKKLSFQGLYPSGIHPSASIHPSAKIDPSASIGAFVFIDAEAQIGQGTVLYPFCFIGRGVTIGKNTLLYPFVTIREGAEIGSFVIIQPGAVIGSCGFGYLPQTDGSWKKLKQLGGVKIEDRVEIGANTTIDRARFAKTTVKRGAKIDNLVQIAHNVEIGENSAIAAQTGISGSSKLKNNVILAGQVGVAGHLEIGAYSQIAAKAGVSKDLKTGKYRGAPAIPVDEYNRQMVHLRKLEKYLKRIEELEKKVRQLEEKA